MIQYFMSNMWNIYSRLQKTIIINVFDVNIFPSTSPLQLS